MFLNLLANQSYLSKLLITLFVVLLSTLLIMIIATIISIPLFDMSLKSILNIDLYDKKYVSPLKFLQANQSVAMFIIPSFLLAFLFSSKPLNYLRIEKSPFLISAIFVSFIMIFSVPIINYLAELNSNMHLPDFLWEIEIEMKLMEAQAEKITELFLFADSINVLLLNIFIIAIIPAIGEELLFRGVFQKLFTDWSKNAHIGIWVSAILFSAMHMQFYGFLPRLLMGAILGYMFLISKNLWLPIIAHFVNNGMAVTVIYLADQNIISNSGETIGVGQGALLSIFISALLVAGLFYSFFRFEKENFRLTYK